MNKTLETLHSMRSIRKFSDMEIEGKKLEEILEATLRTANSGGRQVYSVVVIDDRKLLDEYFYKANKALVFCVDFNRWIDCANHLNHSIQIGDIRGFFLGNIDAIMASQTAIIAAKSLGIDSLATSSLFRIELEKVYKILNLPDKHCFPLISICLGYAKEEPEHLKGRVRKGVIHYNKYQRLSSKEIEEVVDEYDKEENHFSSLTKEDLQKEGYKGFLDSYFSNWNGSFPEEQIIDCYKKLKKVGFFEKM